MFRKSSSPVQPGERANVLNGVAVVKPLTPPPQCSEWKNALGRPGSSGKTFLCLHILYATLPCCFPLARHSLPQVAKCHPGRLGSCFLFPVVWNLPSGQKWPFQNKKNPFRVNNQHVDTIQFCKWDRATAGATLPCRGTRDMCCVDSYFLSEWQLLNLPGE